MTSQVYLSLDQGSKLDEVNWQQTEGESVLHSRVRLLVRVEKSRHTSTVVCLTTLSLSSRFLSSCSSLNLSTSPLRMYFVGRSTPFGSC